VRTVCTVTVYESANFPKTKLKNPSWSAWLLCYAFVVSIQRGHNLHLQPVPITATDDCNAFTSGDEAPIPPPSVADSPVMLPLSQLNEVVRNDESFVMQANTWTCEICRACNLDGFFCSACGHHRDDVMYFHNSERLAPIQFANRCSSEEFYCSTSSNHSSTKQERSAELDTRGGILLT